MASQRTAAQAAQDRNKDRTGKFQHVQKDESAEVQLGARSASEKLSDSFGGLRTLNSTSYDISRLGVRSYLDKISQYVREVHPTATAINYDFATDIEYGVTAKFDSITDAQGEELEADPQVFGRYGHDGFIHVVDNAILQEQLEWVENDDGDNIYRLELDEDSPDFIEPMDAQGYARQLRNMQVALGRQAAMAETVSRIQMLHGQNPDIDEVTIGTSVNGRPIFTSIVRNGQRFESPDVTGDQQDDSGFAWDGWSSALDTQSDYTEIIGNPISTQAASKWVPGMALQ